MIITTIYFRYLCFDFLDSLTVWPGSQSAPAHVSIACKLHVQPSQSGSASPVHCPPLLSCLKTRSDVPVWVCRPQLQPGHKVKVSDMNLQANDIYQTLLPGTQSVSQNNWIFLIIISSDRALQGRLCSQKQVRTAATTAALQHCSTAHLRYHTSGLTAWPAISKLCGLERKFRLTLTLSLKKYLMDILIPIIYISNWI